MTGDITVFINEDPNSSGSVVDDVYSKRKSCLFSIEEESVLSSETSKNRPGPEVLSQSKKKKPKKRRRKSKITNNGDYLLLNKKANMFL